MIPPNFLPSRSGWRWLALALLVTALVYWPGLYGGWLFDDYPNIVDNHGVQPSSGGLASLIKAALSSPASDFKRPLASLSFAANYLATGLDPFGMKLTNLVIHLLNGVALFILTRRLWQIGAPERIRRFAGRAAALITAGWMLLPINLTSVLYVVQRMESMANLAVLVGLLGYVVGRQRMLAEPTSFKALALCVASLIVPAGVGVLAKETAVMLPLYALLIEIMLFGFHRTDAPKIDRRIAALFAIVLLLPLIAGMAWLLPSVLRPETWSTREFTLTTRLLTETRVVIDYIGWTLFPLPRWLSFYHDDYVISTGWLAPWTTAGSAAILVILVGGAAWLRKRHPLAALGIALFLACQLLTATVLPLELVYEHRNYFASFGLVLAVVSVLYPLIFPGNTSSQRPVVRVLAGATLGATMLWWTCATAQTAYAWGDPLSLARELAARGPESPRAQYELGRTYIIYSHYDPNSPFTVLAYAPLERAASLPRSSILPQQALIFMNARIGLPPKASWWDTMIAKLKTRQPGVQDESSLIALSDCAQDGHCDIPQERMTLAFEAALCHPHPSARLLAAYSNYSWNVKGDRALGEQLMRQAVQTAPRETAYRITFIRILVAQRDLPEAQRQLQALEALNVGGYLDDVLLQLRESTKTR